MIRTSLEYDEGRISIGTYPESIPMVMEVMRALRLSAKDLI